MKKEKYELLLIISILLLAVLTTIGLKKVLFFIAILIGISLIFGLVIVVLLVMRKWKK